MGLLAGGCVGLRALPLLGHQAAEALFVDAEAGFRGHLEGQFEREAVGVVQRERIEACSVPSPTWPAAWRPSPRPVPPRSSPPCSTPETLATWGWRIPFLVGGILGLVGLFLRANADETPEFEASSIVDKKSAPARLTGPADANTPRLCCRQPRCPHRPWPTTPGPPSCPPTPASPPAGTPPPP